MSVTFLFSLTVFIVLFLLCVGIYRAVREYKAKRGFIEKIAASAEGWFSPDQETSQVKNRFFNFLSNLGKRASPEKQPDYQQRRIDFLRAGIRHANVLSIFWGTKFFLAGCLPLAFFVSWVTIFKISGFTRALAAVFIFLGVVGLYLPNFWLRLKIARRKNKIFEGIADAMDLLVVCVEAGMGLDSALYRVGEEITLTHKPLGDELKFYNLEMRAGMSRRDALKNLALRVDLEEVRSVASLLIQAEKFGSSIAHSLRIYSDSFRTKRFQRAEEIAAKLPVKLIIPLMLFIMPALFVVLVGPAAISLYHGFLNK